MRRVSGGKKAFTLCSGGAIYTKGMVIYYE